MNIIETFFFWFGFLCFIAYSLVGFWLVVIYWVDWKYKREKTILDKYKQ